jgi:uncharacterized membrane protein YjgN (DUF898 family)
MCVDFFSNVLGLVESPHEMISIVIVTLLDSFLDTIVMSSQQYNSLITHFNNVMFIPIVSCLG